MKMCNCVNLYIASLSAGSTSLWLTSQSHYKHCCKSYSCKCREPRLKTDSGDDRLHWRQSESPARLCICLQSIGVWADWRPGETGRGQRNGQSHIMSKLQFQPAQSSIHGIRCSYNHRTRHMSLSETASSQFAVVFFPGNSRNGKSREIANFSRFKREIPEFPSLLSLLVSGNILTGKYSSQVSSRVGAQEQFLRFITQSKIVAAIKERAVNQIWRSSISFMFWCAYLDSSQFRSSRKRGDVILAPWLLTSSFIAAVQYHSALCFSKHCSVKCWFLEFSFLKKQRFTLFQHFSSKKGTAF